MGWNSKNGKLCGIAMDKNDMTSLKDLYQELKSTQSGPDDNREAAEYYLQFLWRDLSSDFDVIGPHYSSATTMDARFTMTCMMDALRAFQVYGFKVNVQFHCYMSRSNACRIIMTHTFGCTTPRRRKHCRFIHFLLMANSSVHPTGIGCCVGWSKHQSLHGQDPFWLWERCLWSEPRTG